MSKVSVVIPVSMRPGHTEFTRTFVRYVGQCFSDHVDIGLEEKPTDNWYGAVRAIELTLMNG